MIQNTKLSLLFIAIVALGRTSLAQETSIKDLDFFIGTWQAEERNQENGWWEKCTRIGSYVLDSTYIQLESEAVSSTGKKRTYRFMIHYDKTAKHFEMIEMYGNWPKVQVDFLEWNSVTRTLILRSKPETAEYRERTAIIQFSEDYSAYSWKGINKSGDRLKPTIWEYEEKGKREVRESLKQD